MAENASKHPIPGAVYEFSPSKLPQRVRAAIGLVAASASQAESIIDEAIAGHLRIDAELGGALTTQMSMPLRFSVLRSVAEINVVDNTHLDILDDLVARAEKCFEGRNRILHGYFCVYPVTDEVFIVQRRAKRRFEMDLIPVGVEEIEGIAASILELGFDLAAFLNFAGMLPPDIPADRVANKHRKAARAAYRKSLLNE